MFWIGEVCHTEPVEACFGRCQSFVHAESRGGDSAGKECDGRHCGDREVCFGLGFVTLSLSKRVLGDVSLRQAQTDMISFVTLSPIAIGRSKGDYAYYSLPIA